MRFLSNRQHQIEINNAKPQDRDRLLVIAPPPVEPVMRLLEARVSAKEKTTNSSPVTELT